MRPPAESLWADLNDDLPFLALAGVAIGSTLAVVGMEKIVRATASVSTMVVASVAVPVWLASRGVALLARRLR